MNIRYFYANGKIIKKNIICSKINDSKPFCGMLYKEFMMELIKNKYAIHAYTHGPVTGSGPSVKPLKYWDTTGSLLVELRVLPPPPSLIQPM